MKGLSASELAGSLAVLVERSSREHGGVPVKWLGDGVMVHFRDPAGAVLAALGMGRSSPRPGCRQPTSGSRPGRESGRPDRRLCQRQPGPGGRARGPAGAAPGCDLRRAGAGAATGHRPASTAAGSPPGLVPVARRAAASRGGCPSTADEKGQGVARSLPLLIYRAPGGLRQDPGRVAQSPAEARTCGNQGVAKYVCACRRATLLDGGFHD